MVDLEPTAVRLRKRDVKKAVHNPLKDKLTLLCSELESTCPTGSRTYQDVSIQKLASLHQ